YPTLDALAPVLADLWLEAQAGGLGKARASIEPIPRGGPLPLSFGQEQLWFLQQLAPKSSAYNVSFRLSLRGTLDRAALASSFAAIVERHEALRTTFRSRGGVPEAVAGGAFPSDLPVHLVRDVEGKLAFVFPGQGRAVVR